MVQDSTHWRHFRYLGEPAIYVPSIKLTFYTQAPFLKLYTQYVSNYNTALSTLAECKKNEPGLEDFFRVLLSTHNLSGGTNAAFFFQDCANNPETAGKFFGDYQILPVQSVYPRSHQTPLPRKEKPISYFIFSLHRNT